MKTPIINRGCEVDTDKCVQNAGGNRFDMILIATIRAREIARQNRESLKHEHRHSVVTALLEIQDGKIDKEYLKRIR